MDLRGPPLPSWWRGSAQICEDLLTPLLMVTAQIYGSVASLPFVSRSPFPLSLLIAAVGASMPSPRRAASMPLPTLPSPPCVASMLA